MVAHMRSSTCAFLLLIPLLPACGHERSTIPTSPTGTVSPPVMGQVGLSAWVFDTAMRPLVGARVEAADGASAGVSAVTSEGGRAGLTGAFDGGTHFRVTADGHEVVVQRWSCPTAACPVPYAFFYLRPLSPPAIELTGEYTLTITANASCTMLPADAQSRTYRVSLAPRMRAGTADLMGYVLSNHSGAVIESLRGGYFGVAGHYVRSYLVSGEGESPGLIEWLDDTGYVAYTGTAEAAVTPGASSIALSLDGQVEYLQLRAPIPPDGLITGVQSRQTCTSRQHRLVLTAR